MALKTRQVTPDDLMFLREMHQKYYPDLAFPEFHKFIVGFIITDENDKFIMAGGVEPVAEVSLITDKSCSLMKIGRALVEAKQISMYAASRYRIDELLAFVTSDEYAKHLIQHGFTRRNQTALSLRVQNG